MYSPEIYSRCMTGGFHPVIFLVPPKSFNKPFIFDHFGISISGPHIPKIWGNRGNLLPPGNTAPWARAFSFVPWISWISEGETLGVHNPLSSWSGSHNPCITHVQPMYAYVNICKYLTYSRWFITTLLPHDKVVAFLICANGIVAQEPSENGFRFQLFYTIIYMSHMSYIWIIMCIYIYNYYIYI